MANSIIHVGKQNLGNMYVTAGRSKDTFGMYRSNSSRQTKKQVREKFYVALCRTGRKGLGKEQRKQGAKSLIKEYKDFALA